MKTIPTTPVSRRSALKGLGAAAALPVVGPALPRRQQSSLEGKVALVTGSSRGLGRAAVLELARRGADVIVNGRTSRENAEAVRDECEALGVRVALIMADVGVETEVNRLVAQGIDQLGRIDVVIANAAYRSSVPLTEMTTEEWRAAAAVNFDGPFFLSRAVVPGMMANGGGRIITVSGLNSFRGRVGGAHVCGSKVGAIGMTRALAIELAPYGILVNHVVPGAYASRPDISVIPLGRLGLGEELAHMYAFLASDESSFITGQTFHVNGGERRT